MLVPMISDPIRSLMTAAQANQMIRDKTATGQKGFYLPGFNMSVVLTADRGRRTTTIAEARGTSPSPSKGRLGKAKVTTFEGCDFLVPFRLPFLAALVIKNMTRMTAHASQELLDP